MPAFRNPRLSKRNIQKDIISVILINAQVAFGNPKGRVIVDIHEQSRLDSLPPGVIAEGFAQGMAADMLLQSCFAGCLLDDAVRLTASKGKILPFSARKQIVLRRRGVFLPGIVVFQNLCKSVV